MGTRCDAFVVRPRAVPLLESSDAAKNKAPTFSHSESSHSAFASATPCREQQYLVWLEPLKNGGFKFSTAYANVPHRTIREKYLPRANKIWVHPSYEKK